MIRLAVALGALMIATGCARLSRGWLGRTESLTTREMLQSRQGKMNFEEALQVFGPRTNCAEAGQTKTCTWIYGPGGTLYVAAGNTLASIPQSAPRIQLAFTRDLLVNWWVTGIRD